MSKANIIIAIDLEMNQPSNKIIQIGAAVGVLDTCTVIDSFGVYVDPDEPISEFIQNLTGITDDIIAKHGCPIMEAYESLRTFHEKYGAWRNPVTWGAGDNELLMRQTEMTSDTYIFGRRVIDAKTIHTFMSNLKGQMPVGGLAKSMAKWDMEFVGKQHDARDDAYNTMRLYMKLIEIERKMRKTIEDVSHFVRLPKH